MRDDKSILLTTLIILVAGIILGGALLYHQWQTSVASLRSSTPTLILGKPKAPEQKFLTLELNKLPKLEKGHFEAWVVSNGEKYSLGKFRLSDDNFLMTMNSEMIVDNRFIFPEQAKEIKEITISIEPDEDSDNLPSGIILLNGSVIDKEARLFFNQLDWGEVSGNYILATPTNESSFDESSGLWFVKLGSDRKTQEQGLMLPPAPSGWAYQGWIVYQGVALTTGRFKKADQKDDSNEYSADQAEPPPFPGEDFLKDQPADLSFNFPLDLADGKSQVLITLEPDLAGVDPTGQNPFSIQPLSASIPSEAEDHKNYSLQLNLEDTFPTGTAQLSQ